MHQSEKEMFLVKVQEIETKIQELKTWVEGLTLKEATLFDHVEDNPILVPAESAIPAVAAEEQHKTRAKRIVLKDGSMTAATIARRLSKELGRPISIERVVKIGKQIQARPTYYQRQHASRYSPESANVIMNLFRSIV